MLLGAVVALAVIVGVAIAVVLTCDFRPRNGLGVVAPLRLRSPEIAMIGGGKIDFITSRLDLRVASLPHSTGFFALDIPLEITGTLARPSARPAVGSAAEMPDRVPALSADLQAVSDRNSCAR